MLRKLLWFIVCAVTGGPYRICLEKQQGRLTLNAFKGQKPLSFSELPDRYGQLKGLAQSLPAQGRQLAVPPGRLAEVRAILQSLSGGALQVYTAPDVENLRLVRAPADFVVHYSWSVERNRIERLIGKNAQHLGTGWFAAGRYYWQVKGTTSDHSRWLNKQFIEGNEIIEFLRRTVPDWRQRGLPYTCDLRLSDAPLFTASLRNIREDVVEVDVEWGSPPQGAAAIPSLSGYVIADRTIRPGLSPQQLLKYMPVSSGTFLLIGQEIPRFLRDVWPQAHPWISGRVQDLMSLHPVSQESCELILAVRREEREGIGLLIGIPTLSCGAFRAEAEEVSRSLEAGTDFLRLGGKWVPVEELKRAGIGPLGRSTDGLPLSPVGLAPADVLYQRSGILKGCWSHIEFPAISLPEGRTPQEAALSHLEFLRTWGLPGGTVGAIGIAAEAIREMLRSFVEARGDAKVLVVGAKKTLDALADHWGSTITARFDGNRKDPDFSSRLRGIVQATPRALEINPDLARTHWNILCLLEADNLIKSDTSNLFFNLMNCSRVLTIGMFLSTDFLGRTVARRALSQVFAVDQYQDVVWEFGLRHVAEGVVPAQSQPATARKEPQPVEFTIYAAGDPESWPVPPARTMPVPAIEDEADSDEESYEIQFTISYSSGADKFVQEAERLVSRRESHAPHIPFQSYYPTYGSMTSAQLKWYLYWRGQVRDGLYPDTDLSYIFVYVYELINNVGIRDPMDGYDQLRKLWTNYRGRHRNLDNYLLDWIADYVIVNRCPIDPLDIYVEGSRAGCYFSHWDIVLAQYLRKGLYAFPLQLIEQLCDYRIRKSKFYLQGNEDVVNQHLPNVLERVNTDLERGGAGIFDQFKPRASQPIKRTPFQAAVYAGRSNTITIANVYPYREHPPLRQFITAIVKHTENRLREIKKFKGQLRGYSIDPEISAIIDSYIAGAAQVILPPPVKPKVRIDHTKVDALIRDSNEIRDLLLSSDGEAAPPSVRAVQPITPPGSPGKAAADGIARPKGTPAHLLTDLVPVDNLLRGLGSIERQIIETLARNNWRMDDGGLISSLPDAFIEAHIDRINELALNTIGDILIASEGDTKLVADDFRDEVEYLLSLSKVGGRALAQEAAKTMPEEWAELKAKFTELQLQILRVLVEEADTSAAVAKIARENGAMPEVLIDSINEVALDVLGDIIIDTGAVPVGVEEEDLEMVRKLISTG